MKYLSSALIVAAGASIIIASQYCAVAIMKLNPQYSTGFAENIAAIGTGVIIAGIVCWAFCLVSDRTTTQESKHDWKSKGQ